LVIVGVALAAEILVAAPFVFISPSIVRGVPGPLLVVIGLVFSFVLGPRGGVLVMGVSVVLAVVVVGENRVAEPLVWLPAAYAAGWFGDRVRRSEELRRDLLRQLRGGLVALSRSPQVGAVSVITRYLPAEQAQVLAGDFYGIVREPDGSTAVMVGDVAGHGAEAAAVATHLRAAWRSLAVAGVPASRVVELLNDTLLDERAAGRSVGFASVCVGSIRPDAASACFVTAGHPRPLLATPTGVQEVASATNLLIGVRRGAQFDATDIILPKTAWTLLLYTDGLIEGRSHPKGKRPFGLERLTALLGTATSPLAESDIDQLLSQIRHANGGPMVDDIVILALSPAPHQPASSDSEPHRSTG
jgi:hypothetical protein